MIAPTKQPSREKLAYIINNVKDERTLLQKLFGYCPRYSMTITNGIKSTKLDDTNFFFLEDL